MRILITNHALAQRTGSELFVLDLVRLLQAAGHEPEVFTPRPGALAEMARVRVVSDPTDVSPPDVIHAQHHLPAMAALTAWPEVPALYFCHGFRPWEERVPVHPRIIHYAVTSPKIIPWMCRESALVPEQISVVPSCFDPELFPTQRAAAINPRKAAIFNNHTAPGLHTEAIRAACAQAGITLDVFGAAFNQTLLDPGTTLPQYDVVFATGRSALEAMACGCAVVLQSDTRSGPLVTAENFSELREKNFAIRVGAPDLTVESIFAELEKYSPEETADVSRQVREQCSTKKMGRNLLALYDKVLREHNASQQNPHAERLVLARYLAGLDQYLHHGDRHFERLRKGWLATRRHLARAREQRGRKQPWWRKFF